ncbi:winged helix DNA-binding domain-containing protein, partial [Ramicandelaber brevisporus]
KPPYSYTALITRVILASPKRRLTLAQIYDAIKTAYPYYQTSTSSWQNSVRHNLSISKNFMRIPR